MRVWYAEIWINGNTEEEEHKMPKYYKKAVSSTCASVGFAVSALSSTVTINKQCICSEIAESKCPYKGEI
jgi:hypothetical protein